MVWRKKTCSFPLFSDDEKFGSYFVFLRDKMIPGETCCLRLVLNMLMEIELLGRIISLEKLSNEAHKRSGEDSATSYCNMPVK